MSVSSQGGSVLSKGCHMYIDCGKGSSPKSWYTCMSWSSGSNAVFPNLKVKESFIAYDFLLRIEAGYTHAHIHTHTRTHVHTYTHTHKRTQKLATSGTSTTVISKSSPKTRSTTLISAFLLVNFRTSWQGSRTWQPFVGGKNGHGNFRQARFYNFRDKCVFLCVIAKFQI